MPVVKRMAEVRTEVLVTGRYSLKCFENGRVVWSEVCSPGRVVQARSRLIDAYTNSGEWDEVSGGEIPAGNYTSQRLLQPSGGFKS